MSDEPAPLAVFVCEEVDPLPFNRGLDEDKRGEFVRLRGTGDVFTLFISKPEHWGAFKVGATYELRAAAKPADQQCTWMLAEINDVSRCHRNGTTSIGGYVLCEEHARIFESVETWKARR